MANFERQFDMTGALDLEPQDIGPNPPSPHLAESQSHASIALRAWKKISTALFTSEVPQIRFHEEDVWFAAGELNSEITKPVGHTEEQCPAFQADRSSLSFAFMHYYAA